MDVALNASLLNLDDMSLKIHQQVIFERPLKKSLVVVGVAGCGLRVGALLLVSISACSFPVDI